MTVLAIYTICHIRVTFNGNRWGLTAIFLHTSYVFTVLMKEKSAEKVVQTYFSLILAHKGGSVAILKHNGTVFKNIVLNEVCD